MDLARIHDSGDLRRHLDANYRTIPLATAFHRTRFYLDAVVNGVNGRFLLDTGAQDSCIHRASLEKFGLEAETDSGDARGIGGRVDVKRTEVLSFVIGGKIAVEPGPINVVMDDNAVDFDGVIGMNLLDRLRVTVDFGDDTLHFLPPDAHLSATLEEVALKAGCREVELTLFGDLPYVAAKVNGETGRFLLDTDSPGPRSTRRTPKNSVWRPPPSPARPAVSARANSRAKSRVRTRWRPEGSSSKNSPCSSSTSAESAGGGRARDFAGVLGADWLAKHHAVLDIADRRVYFDVPVPVPDETSPP